MAPGERRSAIIACSPRGKSSAYKPAKARKTCTHSQGNAWSDFEAASCAGDLGLQHVVASAEITFGERCNRAPKTIDGNTQRHRSYRSMQLPRISTSHQIPLIGVQYELEVVQTDA